MCVFRNDISYKVGDTASYISIFNGINLSEFHYFSENQQTVHLVCDGLAAEVAQGHWSGLEFFNSTHVVVQDQPSIKINKSASVLEFVDIEFAGVDKNKNPTPAVRAAPLPPRLYNVAVRYSALDGTNFTDVKTSTDVAESLFTGNRGGC